MAKLVFFAVIAVALLALSIAEGDNARQLQCQCQLQESSLDACRQVVDHQLAIQLPFFHPRSSLLRSSEWRTGVRVQCCQQLRHVSPECRAAAIRQIVKHYEQQAVAQLREGTYYPGEEQQGGSYYPGETYPQQEQGWEQQQQQQGRYRPSQTYQQQQEQGWYCPSPTFPHQQQQEGGFCSESTAQQQQGRHESFGSPHLRIIISRHGQQHAAQHELGETAQQQEGQGRSFGRQSQQTGFGGSSSPHRFGTEQQLACLRQLRVVARARQVAAQLPAMCQLEGRVFSASQY